MWVNNSNTFEEIPSRPVLFLFWNLFIICVTSSLKVGFRNIESLCWLRRMFLLFLWPERSLMQSRSLSFRFIWGGFSWYLSGIPAKKLLNPSAIFSLSVVSSPSHKTLISLFIDMGSSLGGGNNSNLQQQLQQQLLQQQQGQQQQTVAFNNHQSIVRSINHQQPVQLVQVSRTVSLLHCLTSSPLWLPGPSKVIRALG